MEKGDACPGAAVLARTPQHRCLAGTTQTFRLIGGAGGTLVFMHVDVAVLHQNHLLMAAQGLDSSEVQPPGLLHSVPITACPQGVEKESDRLELSQNLDLTSYTREPFVGKNSLLG